MMLKKYDKNPVLMPNPANDWESLVVCNPGVWYENGTFYMLYRAAGNDAEHVIRLGLAISKNGYDFERASSEPVFSPSADGPDSGCVEDPRIVKFDDDYYITYAFRPYPPGQYWKFAHDVVLRPEAGENTPLFLKENMGNSGLAVTKDFLHYKKLGRITESILDDRDVILFPEKIKGRYVLMHRPKQYTGEEYKVKYPSIWLKFSDDLLNWTSKESYLLISGRENSWEEKIGGSTPPLKTKDGWLVLYHGVEHGGQGYYRVGALLLDLEDPLKIIGRTKDYILEPETEFETKGHYNGCVFPTGNVIIGDTLYVYYGAADRYVCVATCNVDELIQFIKTNK
ncbi:MAG: glycosidase [Prevotella sp.]|jgi:predicted GH43/DUF377 family glycosyl hydrolase|nr:glycosidase [Prevotella sp.]